jgi:putative flavoprotein involved in K+ transport
VTHRRGVTDVPGVYFLGLLWQHTRGSALLGWVKDDAQFIAQRIDAFAQDHPTSSALLASEADSRGRPSHEPATTLGSDRIHRIDRAHRR